MPSLSNLMVRDDDRPQSPTVVTVCRRVPPVRSDVNCLAVLERFYAAGDIYALPVIDDDNVPVALLERRQFVEYFGKAFTRELHGRRTIRELISEAPGIADVQPMVVAAGTAIDDVAAIIIDKGVQHMVSGVIVTVGARYAGIADGHDLLHEITRRKQAELYYLAHYDQLTGIPNRVLLAERLDMACRKARRHRQILALLYVDLDRFKQINDSMGHAVGDELLRGVADRLRGCVRDCDTVARLGGDEFVVLGDRLGHGAEAEALARRVVGAFADPFRLLDQQVYITASVGIVLYPEGDTAPDGLLAKADAAMLEKKRNGRNGYMHYTDELQLYSRQHLELESDLRRALAQGEFELFFQPQVRIEDGVPIGAEGLLRWHHPQRGLTGPGEFIGIAEETGFITSLGAWVLDAACRQLRQWLDQGLPPLPLSINVSSIQFRDDRFCDLVRETLERHAIVPELIELEVTESVVMHRAGSVLNTLEQLKKIGVRLAIDDFGTGFSSLSYLRRFPIDRLKVDRSFVRDIDDTPVNESIVRAIVALAASLSIELVAEGVETVDEQAALRALGCALAQGYYYQRPVPAAEFQDWVTRHRPRTEVESPGTPGGIAARRAAAA